MGYATYRITNIGLRSLSLSTRELTTRAQALYTVSLVLNFAWMPLFFGLRKPVSAMVDIVGLLGCVGTLTRWYGEIDRVAAFCMLPYLAWVGFATYLTAGVGVRNEWNIDGAVKRAEAKRGD
jgi:benzodiazapine receptor